MAMSAADLLQKCTSFGLTLKAAPPPAANYVPCVFDGRVLWISGQLPFKDGAIVRSGLVGREVSLEDAAGVAAVCAHNILIQLYTFLAQSQKTVVRAIRLGGLIASESSFTQHSVVMNGASDLLVQILGDAGKHARTSIGVSSLPLGAPVEVEAQFLVE